MRNADPMLWVEASLMINFWTGFEMSELGFKPLMSGLWPWGDANMTMRAWRKSFLGWAFFIYI